MLSRLKQSSIHIPWLLLTAIAGGFFFIHITLDIQRKSYGHLSISLLFWIAIATLISERKQRLKLETDPISCSFGCLVLAGLLGLSFLHPANAKILGFYPLVTAIGLALIASGVQNIRQYQAELWGLFLFGLPKLISLETFNISPLTARLSTLMLWYAGFPVQLNGIHISLPTGSVKVVAECSGLNLMLYMFGVSIVFLMLFPTSLKKQLLLPLLAMALGFVLNGIRVALLAYLSATPDKLAFEYWHSEEGALFFVLMTVGLFGLLCWMLIGLNRPKDS